MVLFNAWDSRMNTWKNIQKSGRDGTDRFVDARTLIPGRAVMFATRNDFDWGRMIGNLGMPYETKAYI